MPVDWSLVTLAEPDPAEVAGMLAALLPGARVERNGDLTRVVDAAGGVVLTVVRPRRVAVPAEIVRLTDRLEAAGTVWTDLAVSAALPEVVVARLRTVLEADGLVVA